MSKPELTQEEKLNNVKQLLINQLNSIYGQLINFLKTLPAENQLKEYALMNMDQGAMWAARAINGLNFEVTTPPQDATPAPTPIEDNANATKEGVKQESDTSEHTNGSEGGETCQASGSDSPVGSEAEKKSEEPEQEVSQPQENDSQPEAPTTEGNPV